MVDAAGFLVCNCCVKFQQIVIAGWGAKFGTASRDDKQDALGFKVGIADALSAQQLGASYLEIDPIAAVMQRAHLVYLGIANANIECVGGDFVHE